MPPVSDAEGRLAVESNEEFRVQFATNTADFSKPLLPLPFLVTIIIENSVSIL